MWHISRGCGGFLDFDFSPKSRRSKMKAPSSSKRHIYSFLGEWRLATRRRGKSPGGCRPGSGGMAGQVGGRKQKTGRVGLRCNNR